MWIFPLLATLVSAVFCGVVLRQYLASRRPAYLAWTVALFIFAVATACDFLGLYSGWTVAVVKVYYLAGGTLVVGYLAAGTLFLLAPRSLAYAWLTLMLVITVAASVMLAGASVDEAEMQRLVAENKPAYEAIESSPLLKAQVMVANIAGTIILVGGALWSIVRRRYLAANALIAAGALIMASGGSMMEATGSYAVQSVTQTVGIAVLFAGFLMAMAARGSDGAPAGG